MREIRPSGSVRGVRSNPYPYRDTLLPTPEAACSSDADADRISGRLLFAEGRSAIVILPSTPNQLLPPSRHIRRCAR